VPDLGHLTWYTIYDTTLDRDTLLDRLTTCGLDAFAPAPIEPADAFRRATHRLERLRVPQPDGTAVNWLVREVRTTDAAIVRHLVRETVDAQRVRLDYRADPVFAGCRRNAPARGSRPHRGRRPGGG